MRLTKAVDQFLEGYFSTCQRSDKTIRAYSLDLGQFCTFRGARQDLRGVLPEHLEEWAEELKEVEYAPTSIRRKFASLKVFFNYCVRKRMISYSPTSHLRLDLAPSKVLTRALTQGEMEQILQQARSEYRVASERGEGSPEEFLALRNWILIEILYGTGIRVGELVGLRMGDFLDEDGAFVINGKGGRQRLSFLPDVQALERCRRYRSLRIEEMQGQGSAAVPLFTVGAGMSLTTHHVTRLLSSFARTGGVGRRVTPHMVRHTAATLLLRNGADLRVIQEYLGHSSIATTQRYTHVSKDHLRETVSRYHPAAHVSVRAATDAGTGDSDN